MNMPPSDMRRRHFLCSAGMLGLAALAAPSVWALTALPDENAAAPAPWRLNARQAQAFREWFTLIVHQQFVRGPAPRWQQRDCAGLVRFAVGESLQAHNTRWLKANGLWGSKTPPELGLENEQRDLNKLWQRADGSRSNWVGALELVQSNTRWISKDMMQAQPADLLFFDQGHDQHLMIWMGRYIAYHTGSHNRSDNGLRAYSLTQLLEWKDARWQPRKDNPNFSGVYRLAFL